MDLDSDLEIINPNHYIATISTNNVLEMEFKFEYGTGYQLAGQTAEQNSVDFLNVDAIFMPIQKVDFKIIQTIVDPITVNTPNEIIPMI